MSRRRIGLAALLGASALALAACGDDGGPGVVSDVTDSSDADPGDTSPSDTVDGHDSAGGEDTSAPVDVSPQVSACKAQLNAGQPYYALQEAEAALALAPDDVDANFCAALAGIIDRVEFGLSLFKVLDMASTYNGLVYEPTYSDELAEEIHGIFNYLHDGFALAVARLDRIEGAELSFDVDRVTIQDGPRPLLIHRGRFDRGDTLLIRSIARFAVGLLDILRGQDFRGDMATLIAFIADRGTGGGFDIALISKITAYLLASDERFLTLHPVDGEPAFLEAREVLADLGPEFREALSVIEAKLPTEGVPEVIDAEPLGEGGYLLRVRSRAEVTGDDTLKEVEITVELSGSVLDALDLISQSVREPGTLVPWEGGITVLLAVMINQLIESGALADVKLGGVELPAGFFTVEQLSELLVALVPSTTAFDMGTFYARPVGLRALLPIAELRGGFGEDALLGEWECPDDLDAEGFPQGAQGFVCSKDAELIDAAHFVGTAYELPADGYTSGFPVFVWQDPTWNGLLHVDLSGVVTGAEPGYAPTDASTINIALAEMLTPLLDLLSN